MNVTLTHNSDQAKDVEVVLTRTDVLYLLLELDPPRNASGAERYRLAKTPEGTSAGIWVTLRVEPDVPA